MIIDISEKAKLGGWIERINKMKMHIGTKTEVLYKLLFAQFMRSMANTNTKPQYDDWHF